MILKCNVATPQPDCNCKTEPFILHFANRIGLDGKSAYEVWLAEGNNGTESDFLDWLRQPAESTIGAMVELNEATEAAELGRQLAETMRETACSNAVTAAGNAASEAVSTANSAAMQAVATANGAASEARMTAENAAATAQAAAVSATTAADAADTARSGIQNDLAGMHGQISAANAELSKKAGLDDSKRYLKKEFLDPLGPVAGADTSSGCFKLKGAAAGPLNFEGDRTIRVLFRTGADTVTAGYPFSQKESYSTSMAIRCGDNLLQVLAVGQTYSQALTPNTLYNIEISKRGDAGGEVEAVINGVSLGKKTIASVSNYAPTDISVGRRDADASGQYTSVTFLGEVFVIEVFNYARSSVEMLASWNDGDPYAYRLPRSKVGSGANICVAEYLPSGILADRWRDSSGNGFDLLRLGNFIPAYSRPHDAREVVVDSGVFYTDIASGVAGKVLSIPYGYYLDRVCVCNYNSQNLTAITAQLGAGPVNFLANQSTVAGYGAIITGNLFQSNNTTASVQAQLMPKASSSRAQVTVNATGNTPDGGMRVKLICRWAGL